MFKVWQRLQSFTKVRKICTKRESLWEFASLQQQFPANDAELLPVLERLPGGVTAGSDKQVIDLILAVAEALLRDVIDCVHHLDHQNDKYFMYRQTLEINKINHSQ